MNGHECFVDPEIDNIRVTGLRAVVCPQVLAEEFPLSDVGRKNVLNTRRILSSLIQQNTDDDRLIVIVGPCSIHDVDASLEYADLLKSEVERLSKDLVILMRVYFEKPRTTVGWKGLINDPMLDDSCNINLGLKMARKLLTDINAKGVPVATEYLDCMTPQFISDTISWGAIGARTTESHRELASGLSMPVGFKNGTSGDVQVAIDAVRAAGEKHCFLSVTKQGTTAIVRTKGNEDCHIVLRGGTSGTNYHSEAVAETLIKLKKANVNPRIMIDFSHGNSNKNYRNQSKVCESVAIQIENGSNAILGVMIESHINEGAQFHSPGVTDRSLLGHGISITDQCVGFEETVEMLDRLALAVRRRRDNQQISTYVN